jgi:hypothetical protein
VKTVGLCNKILMWFAEPKYFFKSRETIPMSTWCRYDPAFREYELSTLDILRYKAGVSRDFAKIFAELCQASTFLVSPTVDYYTA